MTRVFETYSVGYAGRRSGRGLNLELELRRRLMLLLLLLLHQLAREY